MTARLGIDARGRLVGRLHARQDLARVLEVALPRLGDPDVASRAIEQLDPEYVLERGDRARHRRGRKLQAARRRGEAFFFSDRDVYLELMEAIHLLFHLQ